MLEELLAHGTNPGVEPGAVQRVGEIVSRGSGLHHVRENFVERADLLNGPLWTRSVCGVGLGVGSSRLRDWASSTQSSNLSVARS